MACSMERGEQLHPELDDKGSGINRRHWVVTVPPYLVPVIVAMFFLTCVSIQKTT